MRLQRSLFESSPSFGLSSPNYLGGGCYGRVFAHPDGETVIKHGKGNDATMAYIWWCHEEQKTGLFRECAPIVHSFSFIEEGGWMATMKLYDAGRNDAGFYHLGTCSRETGSSHDNFTSLLCAWDAAAERLLLAYKDHNGLPPVRGWGDVGPHEEVTRELFYNDLHSGNVVWEDDEPILVDPSGHVLDGAFLHLFPAMLDCASHQEFSLALQ